MDNNINDDIKDSNSSKGSNLDFSLPTDKNKNSNSSCLLGNLRITSILVLISLLISISILLVVLLSSPKQATSDFKGDIDSIKKLAAKLENRKLYNTAAEKWIEYLTYANIDDTERARLQYKIAKLYFDNGNFEKCLEHLFISENTKELEDHKSEIGRMKLDAFRRLGNLAGMNAELTGSTAVNNNGENKNSGIIAEFGPDKITDSDLDKIIEDQIDAQLSQYAMFMNEEQLMKQKEEMQKQFMGEEAKNKALQEYIGQELLMREAVETGIENNPSVQRNLETIRRGFLAQQFINQKIKDQIKLSDTDLEDYYNSHKDEFNVKTKANLSRIIAKDKAKAEEAISKINAGMSFEDAVKEYSIDELTMDNKGKMSSAVEKGDKIPGIGDNPAIQAIIFSLKDGEITKTPIKSDDDMYHIYRMDKLEPEHMKTFEEAKNEIAKNKSDAKRKELIQSTIKELQDKYNVIIHSSALSGKTDAGNAKKSDKEIDEINKRIDNVANNKTATTNKNDAKNLDAKNNENNTENDAKKDDKANSDEK